MNHVKNKLTKLIPVKLKGTKFVFYLRWMEYKMLRKQARKEEKSMEDYIHELFGEALIRR